jgi:hypothetical protein
VANHTEYGTSIKSFLHSSAKFAALAPLGQLAGQLLRRLDRRRAPGAVGGAHSHHFFQRRLQLLDPGLLALSGCIWLVGFAA